jgi:hypothetical protein
MPKHREWHICIKQKTMNVNHFSRLNYELKTYAAGELCIEYLIFFNKVLNNFPSGSGISYERQATVICFEQEFGIIKKATRIS